MARDTTDDWEAIGESEPWYGVLSAPMFLSVNINDQAKEKFYAQGREEIAVALEHIREIDPFFAPSHGLDFGSGLGRLAFAMAATCQSVVGVDVSRGMIAEANIQKAARGYSNVQFDREIPEGGKFDWINSYIVLQHILPRTGYGLIQRLLSALNVGGLTSLHLTFAHDYRDMSSIKRDAWAYQYDGETANVIQFNETMIGEMSMYDYDMNKVLFLFIQAGIQHLKLVHTDHGGVHGFWIFGKKM